MAQENEKFIKVAHRGASGYEPENTLAAFKKAIDLGANMIELDVRVCKSREVVVIHDSSVDRVTNGHGSVEGMTLTELKGLEMQKGERIPTLEEVLDFMDKKAKINIELKGKKTAWPVSRIIDRYVEEKGWSYDDFIVSSFRHDELWKIRFFSWNVKIGVLSEAMPPIEFFSFVKAIGAYSVNVPINRIDEKFVKEAHEKGLKVYVFTANDSPEIEKAKQIGADYICSNYPDKI